MPNKRLFNAQFWHVKSENNGIDNYICIFTELEIVYFYVKRNVRCMLYSAVYL